MCKCVSKSTDQCVHFIYIYIYIYIYSYIYTYIYIYIYIDTHVKHFCFQLIWITLDLEAIRDRRTLNCSRATKVRINGQFCVWNEWQCRVGLYGPLGC